MEVLRAQKAGFCMGVDLALGKLDKLIQTGTERNSICILGAIIHNPQVVESYADKGILTVQTPKEVPRGASVVIRAHGITKQIRKQLKQRDATIVDATCPKVAAACLQIKTHTDDGRTLLLYGEETHPEVKCLQSYAAGEVLTFDSKEQCEQLELDPTGKYCLAAQTTQDKTTFQALTRFLQQDKNLDISILQTLCSATRQRQEEATRIAGEVDFVIVAGGYESSNTRRLAEVVEAQGTRALHIETADELPLAELGQYPKIGLTAGASTPKGIIDEIESRLTSQGEGDLTRLEPNSIQKTAPSGSIDIGKGLRQINRPLHLVTQGCDTRVVNGTPGVSPKLGADEILSGMVPGCALERLGDPEFCRDHGIRYPYVGGSMAKGISSVDMVKALAKTDMLGFFGAAGLLPEEVEAAIDQLQNDIDGKPYGFNLIHSPNEPELENGLVDLYLRRNIRLVEASAFLDLTPALVRYRTHGISRDADGQIITPNRIIAKISREEVAAKFFAPPPERFLQELVSSGALTSEQAEWAAEIPMAQDVTVESDSGGHTDNRPALALFPTIQAQKIACQKLYNYRQRLRVGLGGGIATPAAAAAAFALGAAYLVTGTVNQACIESGTCDEVRQLLAETRQADVTMAPSGDMFEMGVKVQVIKRGTMFSMRAARLYELYRAHNSIEDLPAAERQKLEKTVFQKDLDQVWEETRSFFTARDPRQLAKAESDPKYKLALVFRWYLGQSPVWANRGVANRRLDYQIWCGPAMGAFNEWAKGSFLEAPEQRRTATVAWNILFGAAVLMRANQLKLQGVPLDDEAALTAPLEIEQIKEFLS